MSLRCVRVKRAWDPACVYTCVSRWWRRGPTGSHLGWRQLMPSTQPRNADFLVAIAPYFFITLPLRSSSTRRVLVLSVSRASLAPILVRQPLPFASRAHAVRARLGCETKRDTPPVISKMAEFNGQTLGYYSLLAMNIKVGGSGDYYRSCSVSAPRKRCETRLEDPRGVTVDIAAAS